jgi:hypothetical protein
MLSNQCLTLAPEHPLAIELFDLVGLQWVVIDKQNAEAAKVHAGGDRAAFDRLDEAMRLISEKIQSLFAKYRDECSADASCTVSFTHDARGYPLVKSRPVFTLH